MVSRMEFNIRVRRIRRRRRAIVGRVRIGILARIGRNSKQRILERIDFVVGLGAATSRRHSNMLSVSGDRDYVVHVRFDYGGERIVAI